MYMYILVIEYNVLHFSLTIFDRERKESYSVTFHKLNNTFALKGHLCTSSGRGLLTIGFLPRYIFSGRKSVQQLGRERKKKWLSCSYW